MNKEGCSLLTCPKFKDCGMDIEFCAILSFDKCITAFNQRILALEEETEDLKAYKPKIGEYSSMNLGDTQKAKYSLLHHLEYDEKQVDAGIKKVMKQPFPPEYFAEDKEEFINKIRKNFETETGNTPTFEVIKDGKKEIRYRSEYTEYLENELFERSKA
jgi:hypothetical protein